VTLQYVNMRANLRYLRGELLAVRADWARSIVAGAEVVESRFLLGGSLHALGQVRRVWCDGAAACACDLVCTLPQLRGALTSYDAALKLQPQHQAYYVRAIAVCVLDLLDEPVRARAKWGCVLITRH
jgi:hypothetical protein